MSHTAQPRPIPRSNAEYRWTRAKAVAFVGALAEQGSVAGAAREVGMSRKAAYALRARLGEGFARAWAMALEAGREQRRSRRGRRGKVPLRAPQGDTSGAPR